MDNKKKIYQIAKLIKESKYAVVLTGAGVSTGSGIPDFRTPGKGIWEKVDPFIGEGLRYLRCTQEGQQWVANLYANLFTEENEIPAFGPERRTSVDRRSQSTNPSGTDEERRAEARRKSDKSLFQSINRKS